MGFIKLIITAECDGQFLYYTLNKYFITEIFIRIVIKFRNLPETGSISYEIL